MGLRALLYKAHLQITKKIQCPLKQKMDKGHGMSIPKRRNLMANI